MRQAQSRVASNKLPLAFIDQDTGEQSHVSLLRFEQADCNDGIHADRTIF